MSDFRLARLQRAVPIVDKNGLPTIEFQRWWQNFATQIEAELGALEAAQAAAASAAVAQTAAATAQTAASTAQTSANTANTAATNAQTSATTANSVASLTNSGVAGCTITGADAGTNVTVTISAHTRVYGSGTSVAVNGGTVTALAYSTTYFIYYDQASRAGGAVTYAATTSEATAAQTGDRHLVGMVVTPAAAAPNTDGDYVRVPGVGGIIP